MNKGQPQYGELRLAVFTEAKPTTVSTGNETPYGSGWWKPLGCRSMRGSIRMNGGIFAPRCGNRSCHDCHVRNLYNFMAPAKDLKKNPGNRLYSCVLTPRKRIETHKDVQSFLDAVRRLCRKWERTHGAEYGYWVAECVPKPEEGLTNIPCPVRAYDLPDAEDMENKYHLDAIQNMIEVKHACHEGKWCPYCNGTGYLPKVHLHVHLALSAPPFYYGEGEVPQDDRDWDWIKCDFNGQGFYGFVNGEGLGVSRAQSLKSKEGIAGYLSKACIQYFSKGSETKRKLKLVDLSFDAEKWCNETGSVDDIGSVDWANTQRGSMIASAIYGNLRHRGTFGKAYGTKIKNTDLSDMPLFSSHHDVNDALSGGMGTALIQELKDKHYSDQLFKRCEEYQKLKKMEKVAKQMERRGEPLFMRSLLFGAKRQENLNIFSHEKKPSKVLIETQVDMGMSKGMGDGESVHLSFLRENRGEIFVYQRGSDSGGMLVKPRFMRDPCFSKQWDKVPVVSESDCWATFKQGYLVFGRGSSVVSFPSTSLCQSSGRDVHWIEDIGPILEALSQMTWKEWGMYRQYVTGGGLIRDWLEQVA